MNKKQKNIGIIVLILIGILAVAFFGNGGKLPFAVSGTSALSLSNVDLQSNNAFLNGQAWLLTFSAGGLGQSYYGTFSPSQIKDSDGTQATNPFTISVDYADETCQYPISNTGSYTPIYKNLQYKSWYCLYPSSNIQDYITSSGFGSVILYGGQSWSPFTCFAVGTSTQDQLGEFSQTNVNQPYTISLNVNGQTATKTIDPLQGSGQGALGTFAYASWNGNLVSGAGCPNSADYQPAYVNGNWIVVKKQNYQDYLSVLNNYPTGNPTSQTIQAWVTLVNQHSPSAELSQNFGTVTNSASINSAIVKYTTSSPVQFPVTSLYIKADTLGIFTPVPDIRINSADSSCFRTGANGIISVSIENKGTQGGTYTVFATCDNPFTISQNQQGSLNPRESRVVNLPLSASATQKQTGSCIVSVQSTGGTKTATASVCVDPQITCTLPYPKTFCGKSGNLDAVQQCSSDGATTNTIKTCTATQYCDTGECKDNGSGGGVSWLSKLWDSITGFFGTLGDILTVVKWIVLITGSIFSFAFGRQLLEKLIKGKDKTSRYIILGISVLLGIGVAFLLYAVLMTSLFWMIIVGLIVFNIIIKLVIPRI